MQWNGRVDAAAPDDAVQAPAVLWTPDPDEARESRIAGFARWVREHRDVGSDFPVDDLDYAGLHAWSVRDLDGFWSALADHLGVIFHDPPTATLGRREMPGTEWFPGATLNYAEHALTPGPGRGDDDIAAVAVGEDGTEREVTHAELRDLVARARAGLAAAGVGAGRPGRRAGTQLRRDPRRLPRDGVAGCGVVVVLTGLRRRGPCSTASPRSSRPCSSPSTATATTASGSTCGRPSGPCRRRCPRCGPRCWCRTSTPRRRSTARSRGRRSPPPPRRWSSRPSRSTTRCGCSTPRGRPGCPRASCSRTAGSSSSTSRRSPSSTTSAPATGSCGSPPPAG